MSSKGIDNSSAISIRRSKSYTTTLQMSGSNTEEHGQEVLEASETSASLMQRFCITIESHLTSLVDRAEYLEDKKVASFSHLPQIARLLNKRVLRRPKFCQLSQFVLHTDESRLQVIDVDPAFRLRYFFLLLCMLEFTTNQYYRYCCARIKGTRHLVTLYLCDI